MTDIVEWLRWNEKEQRSRFGEAANEIERLQDEVKTLVQSLDAATKYAHQLTSALAKKYYPEVDDFKPSDSLHLLLTQIDNMSCGLRRIKKEKE